MQLSSHGGHATLAPSPSSVMVIDFWASWCEPCAKQLPALQRFSESQDSRVRVVSVNVGESQAQASAFYQKLGVKPPLFFDPEHRLADKLGIRRFPTLLVVDPKGKIIYWGEHLDSKALSMIESEAASLGDS